MNGWRYNDLLDIDSNRVSQSVFLTDTLLVVGCVPTSLAVVVEEEDIVFF